MRGTEILMQKSTCRDEIRWRTWLRWKRDKMKLGYREWRMKPRKWNGQRWKYTINDERKQNKNKLRASLEDSILLEFNFRIKRKSYKELCSLYIMYVGRQNMHGTAPQWCLAALTQTVLWVSCDVRETSVTSWTLGTFPRRHWLCSPATVP